MTGVPSVSRRPRVVLICHHDAPIHREGLARWIGSWATLGGTLVIREPGKVIWRRIHREWRRVGWRLVDVLAFRLFYRLRFAARDAAWLRARLAAMRDAYPTLPAAPVLDVASPNSVESETFLRRADPDLVLALCKNILAERIFTIPRHGTFVLHPGICPEYRNAHGCFWALAMNDLTRVGMTVLRIDRGIDTGPVLGYFSAAFDELRDTHATIQHQVVLDNLDGIRDLLLGVVQHGERPIDVAGRASREWGQPWLTAWFRWKRAARAREGKGAHRQP